MTQPVLPTPSGQSHRLTTEPRTSRAWWFLGSLVVLRNPGGSPTAPAVMEMTFPPGGFSPLHQHAEIDDNFLMLDGQFAVRSGDETFLARAGTYVCLPHGVPYTTRVVGTEPARMVVIHNRDNFVSLLEAVGVPATEHRLPREGEGDVDMEKLMTMCAELQMPVLGPPMDESEAEAIAQAHADVTA